MILRNVRAQACTVWHVRASRFADLLLQLLIQLLQLLKRRRLLPRQHPPAQGTWDGGLRAAGTCDTSSRSRV